MFFFFNNEQLESKLEMKETDREIKASFEGKPYELVKDIFMEDDTTERSRRPSLGEMVSRYERETQERMKEYRAKAEALRRELDEAERQCAACRKERDAARALAEKRLKRCRELEDRNARLEADHERHKNSLVCLTDRLADLERENARLRDAIGHFYGECAEFVQGASTPTAPTVVAQHHYYPGSLHVSGSHLPDAHFTPAPTGHELTRK